MTRIIDALIAWPAWATAWAARRHRERRVWRVMRAQNRRAGK